MATETNCSILEQLEEISGLTLTMAKMGRLTLKELDRVCAPTEEPDQLRTGEMPPQQSSDAPAHFVPTETVPTASNHHDSYYLMGMLGLDSFKMFDRTST
ncbi:hypothetical protein E8E11_010077 [Didymella keratinophila]|nr:hypothetical protein E8E11_010077 [Didymella keratinophila]